LLAAAGFLGAGSGVCALRFTCILACMATGGIQVAQTRVSRVRVDMG